MSAPRLRSDRRGRGFAVTLGALILMAGCGRGGGAAGSQVAAGELHDAARATLAASSFVMSVASDAVAGAATVVYQAPDRIRTYGSGGAEMIAIGRTIFSRSAPPPMPGAVSSAPPVARPGTFQRAEAPTSGPGAVDGTLAEVKIMARADRVERDGPGFSWRAGSGRSAVSGHARVEGGRIAEFTVRSSDSGWTAGTYRFSDYGTAPAVEPPPAAQVVDASAMMTPCAPDGSIPAGHTTCFDRTG